MHYLIDGHNLIARLSDISLDDPNDEAELILRLKSWAAANRKRKVTVIFDGGLPGGVSHRLSTSDIKVIFAPEGKTADSLIIKRIRKIKNPPETTLVTNDRQIINAAQKRRMPQLRSDAFAAQMRQNKHERTSPPRPPDTDDPHLSQSEVAEWLELFGPEPELPSQPKPARRTHRARPTAKRRKKHRPPQELKTTDSILNDDEIAEWLEMFSQD